MSAEVDQTAMCEAKFCERIYALAAEHHCVIIQFDWDRHIIVFEGAPEEEHALAVALGEWLDV